VLTLADGWCVCVCVGGGQWAQLEADCVSATHIEDLKKATTKNKVCPPFLLHK